MCKSKNALEIYNDMFITYSQENLAHDLIIMITEFQRMGDTERQRN
jgi:hypothetical protein